MGGAVAPAVLEALVGVVGSAHVLGEGDEGTRHYGEDWRGLVSHAPALVLRPGCTAEVAAVMKILAAARLPVVPQGGNTGMCGGAVPGSPGREVVVSLSRMRRIGPVDLQTNSMVVEAGAVLAAV